jgi:hypothetical protein
MPDHEPDVDAVNESLMQRRERAHARMLDSIRGTDADDDPDAGHETEDEGVV